MMSRRGFSLTELVITMVIAGVLGAAVTKILITTSRFYGQDAALRGARTVSRSALGLLDQELRMVDATGGVVRADSAYLTVRQPFAMGVLCTTGGATATVSLLPVDSLVLAGAGFSGYAWRDASGAWVYVEAGAKRSTGSAAACSGASVTTLAGGSVVALTPAPPATAGAGTPVFLFQRISYRFAPSSALPGRVGLWRDVEATGLAEELAAPFDAGARFRFLTLNADTSRVLAPLLLADLRGVELVLTGASERTPLGRRTPESVRLTTAVFFMNRPD